MDERMQGSIHWYEGLVGVSPRGWHTPSFVSISHWSRDEVHSRLGEEKNWAACIFREQSVQRRRGRVSKDQETSHDDCDNCKEGQTILLRALCKVKNKLSHSQSFEEVGSGGKDGVQVSGIIWVWYSIYTLREHQVANVIWLPSRVQFSSGRVSYIWILSMDDASKLKGSGIWIVLEGSYGLMIMWSLKFEFKTNENQDKDKSFIVGMVLSIEMGVSYQMAISKSQLMEN